jgi:hypothetical protein
MPLWRKYVLLLRIIPVFIFSTNEAGSSHIHVCASLYLIYNSLGAHVLELWCVIMPGFSILHWHLEFLGDLMHSNFYGTLCVGILCVYICLCQMEFMASLNFLKCASWIRGMCWQLNFLTLVARMRQWGWIAGHVLCTRFLNVGFSSNLTPVVLKISWAERGVAEVGWMRAYFCGCGGSGSFSYVAC